MAFVPDAVRRDKYSENYPRHDFLHVQSKLTANNSEAAESKLPRSAVTCRPIYTTHCRED